MNQKLKKLSVRCFLLAVALMVVSYFCFHFLTDGGFTLQWHPEAGKPFVTEMLGDLAVLFLFGGIFCRMAANILFPEEK